MAADLSIELETGTEDRRGVGTGSPSSGLPTGTATAGTSLTSPFTVQLSATGTLGASPGSPSSVQLVALQDSSLPLALEASADADARGRWRGDGPCACRDGSPGDRRVAGGSGDLRRAGFALRGPRGGVGGGPDRGIGRTGRGPEPGHLGRCWRPWEPGSVLGLDEASRNRERAGAGGLMGPSQPGDRPAPSPREGRPAEGSGSGLRSVPDPAPRRRGVEDLRFISLPANSTGALDAVNARVQDPWRRGADRDRRADVIDVAIATLDADRSGDHRDEDKLPAHRLAIDSAGLAPVFVAVCHLASRLVRPLGATWRSGFARGEEGAPGRRRHRARIRAAIQGLPADRRVTLVDDVIPFDPDPRTHRLRPSSREPTGPVPSPTGAGAESIQ